MGETERRLTSRLAAFIGLALIAAALILAAPAARAGPAGSDLGMTIFLQRQAALQAVAYSAVRAAVEDGQRPASDLAAARRSLKAAQVALYDQVDQTRRVNDAFFEGLRKENARRLKGELIQVRAAEAELPSLSASARPNAEARLALSRQVLEGYQANVERLANAPAAAPRPKLPILPARP